MKTPIILLLGLLLAAAVQAATVTLTPGSVYETTSAWQTLDINNYKGSAEITSVALASPGLTITDAEDYAGWTTDFDADSAAWTGGSVGGNVKSAVFEFQALAPNVSANANTTITVTSSGTTVFNITILNDATAPTLSNQKPNSYAKANNPSVAVSVNATDSETSVTSVIYTFNNCGNTTNTTAVLTKGNDTFLGTADFTGYDEGETACYTFIATNAPGEKSALSGTLIFDGTAPAVTAVSPTGTITDSTTFVFTASDNLATTLSCEVKLDTTTLTTLSVANGSTTSLPYNLTNVSEGSHTWSVTCTDGVGLSATHAQAIVIDTQPPSITLSYNPFILRTVSSVFNATVTDTVGLSSVNATFDASAVSLTQSGSVFTGSHSSSTLGAKTLTVTATDGVGHVASTSVNVTVIPNHALTLELDDYTVTPGESVTASGSLLPDGTATVDEVTLRTPLANYTVDLDSNAFSKGFTAPSDDGTYTITVEYTESGYKYTKSTTLTVNTPSSGSLPPGDGSNGWESSWSGAGSYVKPGEEQSQDGQDNSNQQTEPSSSEQQTPSQQYQPLPPETPRQALQPKATGIFKLAGAVKWLAILLALAIIAGLGVYAYKKRGKKEDDGIDWNSYFNNK